MTTKDKIRKTPADLLFGEAAQTGTLQLMLNVHNTLSSTTIPFAEKCRLISCILTDLETWSPAEIAQDEKKDCCHRTLPNPKKCRCALNIILATIAACTDSTEEYQFVWAIEGLPGSTEIFPWSTWSRPALKTVTGLCLLFRENEYEFDDRLSVIYAQLFLQARHVKSTSDLSCFGLNHNQLGQAFDRILNDPETHTAAWLYTTLVSVGALIPKQISETHGGHDVNALAGILHELSHKIASKMNIAQMVRLATTHKSLFYPDPIQTS